MPVNVKAFLALEPIFISIASIWNLHHWGIIGFRGKSTVAIRKIIANGRLAGKGTLR
jgi:hypothetical protein